MPNGIKARKTQNTRPMRQEYTILANQDKEIASMEIEVTLYNGKKARVTFDPWEVSKGFLCPKSVTIEGERIWLDDVIKDIGSQVMAECRRRIDIIRVTDLNERFNKDRQAYQETIAELQKQLAPAKETEQVTETTNGQQHD